MEPHSLFEGPGHARKIPGGLIRGEALRNILRTQNPRIVRQPAGGMRAAIGIDQLPGRWDADFLLVKGVALTVLDEVEQMRVRPIEFLGAVDAESVVPDDPAAAR